MHFVIRLWCFLAAFHKWETHGETTISTTTDVLSSADNITITALPNATSFFLNWSLPAGFSDIANYVITVINEEVQHYIPPSCPTLNLSSNIGNTTVTNFTYTDAAPDYYYFIKIEGYDTRDTVLINGTTSFTTLNSVPGAPRDVDLKKLELAEDSNNFSIQVYWKTPCEPNGNISSYTLSVYQVDAPDTSQKNETVPAAVQEEYSQKIQNLEPYKNYNLVIFAVGSDNREGTSTSHTFFTDVEKLDVIVDVNATYFSLQWNSPNSTCNSSYNIEYIALTPKHFVPQICSAELPQNSSGLLNTSYTYDQALADYEYELTIKAYCNDTSVLVASTSLTFSTMPTVPGAPTITNSPLLPYLNENNTISVNLSWSIPCQSNGNISMYKIQLDGKYQVGDHIATDTIDVDAGYNQTNISFVINNLMPYSVYTIDVAAVGYENLTGDKSDLETIETPSSIPGTPNVTITNITSTSFDISWTIPEEKSGPIISYDLNVVPLGPQYEYNAAKCSPNSTTQSTNIVDTTYEFTLGQPYFAYNVSVAAKTDAGAGVPDIRQVVTLYDTSAPPENLSIFQNANISYMLSWTVPCEVNGPISHFNISVSGNYTEDNSHADSYACDEPYVNNTFNYSIAIPLLESYHYTIQVSVIANNISGEVAQLSITTNPGIPGRPTNITVSDSVLFSTSRIQWSPPVDLKGRLSYDVIITALWPLYYTQSNCNMPRNVTYNESFLNSTIIHLNLNPFYHYYHYSIAVRARTEAGPGDYNTIYQSSVEGAPESVSLENVYPVITNLPTEQYNATATINFQFPCFLNGMLANYTLDYNTSDTEHKRVATTDNAFVFNLEPEKQYDYKILTYNTIYYNASNGTKSFLSPSGVPEINLEPNDLSLDLKDNEAIVTLRKEDYGGPNGVVRYLALILTDRDVTGDDIVCYESGTWPNITNTQPGMYYQLTEDRWQPFNQSDTASFTIGGGSNNCDETISHCNKPLEPNTEYFLIVRVYTNNFYRNSPTIHFQTNNIKQIIIIVIAIAGVVIPALLGFLIFMFWKKKMLRLPGVLYIKSSSTKHTPIITTSVPVKKFITYCKFLDNNPDKMKEQYILLTEQSKEASAAMTTNFAKLTENKRKNRYINILPYDETRVKLLIDEDDDLGSDYINASYIKGYSGQSEYIATQGPLEGTCRDFWKMILQENVSIIVMVSQFIENDRPKCYRYFPRNRDTMLVEDIEIRCSMELHFGIYCVRMLQVRKDNAQANIVHMQFLEWPDFGVPTGTEHMLQFCYQIRERIKAEGGCTVIHCSAGVGRTGTLIATDILLQTAKAKKNIDVFNTLLELRRQRNSMVQTEKQYIYIHHLIRDHLDRPPSSDYIDNSSPIYENLSVLQEKSESEIDDGSLPKKPLPAGKIDESSF